MKLLFCLSFFPLLAFASLESHKNNLNILTSDEFTGRGLRTAGHKLARDFIASELRQIGLETEILTNRSYLPWLPKAHNILAKFPGNNKGKSCIALTAHYDHEGIKKGEIYPGAMDNAAGVSLLLELAKKLKKIGFSTQADIYFAFPDQEEKFLVGSHHLIKALKKKCQKILFNFNFDTLGAPFFNGLEKKFFALGSESSSSFAKILPAMKTDQYEAMKGGIYIIEPLGIPRSDYSNFRWNKIPFLFITNGTPWFYHSPADTPDKIDFDHLEDLTLYAFNLLKNFQLEEKNLPFDFIKKPEFDFKADAEKVKGVLQILRERSSLNNLEEEDLEKLDKHIEKLQNPGKKKLKYIIQRGIIDLLGMMKGPK